MSKADRRSKNNPQLNANGELTHLLSTEGLPREIALRQKQYEHYRNLLLSFPKPAEGAGA